MIELHLVYGFWLFRACAGEEYCKFRPSGSLSPRRELQNFGSEFDSRSSLRRPELVLNDLVSRSGERYSPERGRDENFMG